MAFLIGFLMMDAQLPATPSAGLFWVASLVLALTIKFSLAFLIGLAASLFTQIHFLVLIREAVSTLLAGTIMPIWLLPGWLPQVAEALPFYASVGLPTDVYMGRLSGLPLIRAVSVQVFWAVGLWILGAVLASRVLRRITIYGG